MKLARVTVETAVVGALLALVSPAAAETDATGESAGPAGAARPGVSPTLAAGAAIVAVGYSQYGVGMMLRAGADTRVGGALEQRVGASSSITRFTIPGAMLDLATAEATYRLYPLRVPVFLSASAGLVVSREAFDVTLARGRRIEDVHVRAGAPGSLGVGLTLFRHVELEASYRQALFFGGEGPTTFGSATLALGGRW